MLSISYRNAKCWCWAVSLYVSYASHEAVYKNCLNSCAFSSRKTREKKNNKETNLNCIFTIKNCIFTISRVVNQQIWSSFIVNNASKQARHRKGSENGFSGGTVP